MEPIPSPGRPITDPARLRELIGEAGLNTSITYNDGTVQYLHELVDRVAESGSICEYPSGALATCPGPAPGPELE